MMPLIFLNISEKQGKIKVQKKAVRALDSFPVFILFKMANRLTHHFQEEYPRE
jgi:hypothetical protein